MDASQTREFVVKLRLTTPKACLSVSTAYPNRRQLRNTIDIV